MERKLPTPDPRRLIGRWAVSLNHKLFRIDEATKDQYGAPLYRGEGISGETVTTGIPSLLTREDGQTLDYLLSGGG